MYEVEANGANTRTAELSETERLSELESPEMRATNQDKAVLSILIQPYHTINTINLKS